MKQATVAVNHNLFSFPNSQIQPECPSSRPRLFRLRPCLSSPRLRLRPCLSSPRLRLRPSPSSSSLSRSFVSDFIVPVSHGHLPDSKVATSSSHPLSVSHSRARRSLGSPNALLISSHGTCDSAECNLLQEDAVECNVIM
ncbi:hypothetical protein NC653_010585 [Populus alba x Populus x berolinensis]|uniref:Uncharacterized protein n=1 Tax=Populus alba x Populus x berolinensis TaxID=444605 RepID=A0AAD6R0A5_9ROSI|nr:hypothetical protein NC653_010585 [Populus alba x Populus x berolinensis]